MLFDEVLKSISFLFIFSTISLMLMVCLFYEKYAGIHIHTVAGTVILSYFVLQSCLALLNYRYELKMLNDFKSTNERPSICFAVIGYREDNEYWKNCLSSLFSCPYENITGIYAFVDGNENDDQFMYETFEEIYMNHKIKQEELQEKSHKSSCLMLPHRGKRFAMYDGFQYIKKYHPKNDYIVIIDSDTIVEPLSTTALVSSIHKNPNIGCATGTLRIFNRINLLTKIINARYAYAFDIERAAMSYFGCMNCCSGPYSIYRQSVLTDNLLEDFIKQTYCCIQVGPGDDRHLTNLVMMSGYKSVQTAHAFASTESPVQFYRFLNQQLRWMRSFYREQIWQVRSIPYQHIYLSIITTYEILFPFFILLGFFQKFFVNIPMMVMWHRVIYGVSILTIRTLLLLWIQKWQLIYLLNMFYFPLYFAFILPIKIYAMLTCYKMGWITSARYAILTNSNIETTMMTGILTGWVALIVYYITGFDI